MSQNKKIFAKPKTLRAEPSQKQFSFFMGHFYRPHPQMWNSEKNSGGQQIEGCKETVLSACEKLHQNGLLFCQKLWM